WVCSACVSLADRTDCQTDKDCLFGRACDPIDHRCKDPRDVHSGTASSSSSSTASATSSTGVDHSSAQSSSSTTTSSTTTSSSGTIADGGVPDGSVSCDETQERYVALFDNPMHPVRVYKPDGDALAEVVS